MIVLHETKDRDLSQFQDFLKLTTEQLGKDTKSSEEYFLTRNGTKLETDIHSLMKKCSTGTIFENNIELVSGQKFPDIVSYVNENKAFGLEVKTTSKNNWKSVGGSIFESTRVENVEHIYMLFGKLVSPIEYICRSYQDCLYDVAITHSPRYLIDMEIQSDESIFSKIGIEYDDLRKLEHPFEPIKDYFRANLKDKGEDIWWIDKDPDSYKSLTIKHWRSLSTDEKEHLRIIALAYFPELLGNSSRKYTRLSTWLVSRFGVVNHALRDTFTAGGLVKIDGVSFPRIFEHLETNFDSIQNVIAGIEERDKLFYWDCKIIKDKTWENLCYLHSTYLTSIQKKVLSKILGL